MRQYGTRPINGTAVSALIAVAIFFSCSLVVRTALAGERYAAKPVGWDSPAGACVVCHSLEKNGPLRVGPPLWGIVGASKGRAKGYGYSLALAKAGGKWTEHELDEYLESPSRFLPGTSKTIVGLPSSKERQKIIAYLATLKDSRLQPVGTVDRLQSLSVEFLSSAARIICIFSRRRGDAVYLMRSDWSDFYWRNCGLPGGDACAVCSLNASRARHSTVVVGRVVTDPRCG